MKTFNIHKLIISTMKDAVMKTVEKHEKSDGLMTPHGKLVGIVVDNQPDVIFIEYKTDLRSKYIPFAPKDGINILRKERKTCEHEDVFISMLLDEIQEQSVLVDEPVYITIQRLMYFRETLASERVIPLFGFNRTLEHKMILPEISHTAINRLINIVSTYGISNTITLMEDNVDYIDIAVYPKGDIAFRTQHVTIKMTMECGYNMSIIINDNIITEENLDTASIYANRAIVFITTNIESYLNDIENTWKLDESL